MEYPKEALIIPLPSSYPESFSSSEAKRGNTTWCTLCSSQLAAGIASCPPSGTLALHRHKQAELYHVIAGSGVLEVEGRSHALKKGITVFIPGDAEHGVRNNEIEDLRWLYVFPGKFEDVVYRFRHEGAYGGAGESKDVLKAKL